MKITYTLTDEDKQKYIDTNFDTKKKTIPKILVFVGSIILLIIAIMALISEEYLIAIFTMLFLFIIYVLIKLPKGLRKNYIESLEVDEERTIELNDIGLTVNKPSRTTTYKYSDISSVELIDDYFTLLKFKPGDSAFIPSSAFSTKDEMIDFINKIKTNAKIL